MEIALLESIIFVGGTAEYFMYRGHPFAGPARTGFYRFFAWELLLLLFLLNMRKWIEQPLAPHQLVAWSLLFIALFLIFDSAIRLRIQGAPSDTAYG